MPDVDAILLPSIRDWEKTVSIKETMIQAVLDAEATSTTPSPFGQGTGFLLYVDLELDLCYSLLEWYIAAGQAWIDLLSGRTTDGLAGNVGPQLLSLLDEAGSPKGQGHLEPKDFEQLQLLQLTVWKRVQQSGPKVSDRLKVAMSRAEQLAANDTIQPDHETEATPPVGHKTSDKAHRTKDVDLLNALRTEIARWYELRSLKPERGSNLESELEDLYKATDNMRCLKIKSLGDKVDAERKGRLDLEVLLEMMTSQKEAALRAVDTLQREKSEVDGQLRDLQSRHLQAQHDAPRQSTEQPNTPAWSGLMSQLEAANFERGSLRQELDAAHIEMRNAESKHAQLRDNFAQTYNSMSLQIQQMQDHHRLGLSMALGSAPLGADRPPLNQQLSVSQDVVLNQQWPVLQDAGARIPRYLPGTLNAASNSGRATPRVPFLQPLQPMQPAGRPIPEAAEGHKDKVRRIERTGRAGAVNPMMYPMQQPCVGRAQYWTANAEEGRDLSRLTATPNYGTGTGGGFRFLVPVVPSSSHRRVGSVGPEVRQSHGSARVIDTGSPTNPASDPAPDPAGP